MNTTMDTEPLPELSDDRVDLIESAVFSRIASERSTSEHRRVRRGRIWMAGGAAAAVIAVAAIIAPTVGGIVGGSSGADSAAVQPASGGGWSMLPEGSVIDGTQLEGTQLEGATADGARTLDEATTSDLVIGAEESGTAQRDIITSASASITVEDVQATASAIRDAAGERGGYVESMNVGTTGTAVPVDPRTGAVYDSTMYSPVEGAWITVRVPSAELSALVAELNDLGEVTASTVNRQDVTDQTVDLDARIAASQASVDRLTELMAQAGDLSDLIAAESALADRQATLESLQQQRDSLGDQVAMSSLTVSLSPVVETVKADPAGFGDGLGAGWNGLVATLNGIVIALGFLLPWLGVAAVAWLIVWSVVRLVRRRRTARTTAVPSGSSED